MVQIHLIGGEKGGVGKSFVCRSVVSYHLRHQLPLAVFDADRTNANVLRTYGKAAGVRRAVLSEGEEFDTAANAIFNTALDGKRVVVNLPAQVLPALSFWIEENDLFEMAVDNDVELVHWFVSDGEADSLALFEQVLDTFAGNMRHVLVANDGKTRKWKMLMNRSDLLLRLKEMDIPLMRFPRFVGNDDRKRIDALSLTFEEVQESDAFDAFGRQHVKSFLERAFAQFEKAGVFDEYEQE